MDFSLYKIQPSVPTDGWDWRWNGAPYFFNLQVFDENNQPVDKATINLDVVKNDGGIGYEPIAAPVTDSFGFSSCVFKLTELDEKKVGQSITIRISVGDDSGSGGSSGSGDFYLSDYYDLTIGIIDNTIGFIKVPATTTDGYIDDDEYDSGVNVNVMIPGMIGGESLYLLWGDFFIEKDITSVDEDSMFTFTMEKNDLFFQNGSHLVRAFVADQAGNSTFAQDFIVTVNRVRGGGLEYAPPVICPEPHDHGSITDTMAKNGVHFKLSDDELKYQEPGSTVNFGNLYKTLDSLNFSIVGYVGKEVINHVTIAMATDELNAIKGKSGSDPEVPDYPDYTTIQTIIPYDFLTAIGEGHIEVNYFAVCLDEHGIAYTFTVPKSLRSIYAVDVLNP